MALANMRFKDQNWSHFGEERNVKREKKRKGRGRREEEEGGIKLRYGTNLGYEFYYGSYGFCMKF